MRVIRDDLWLCVDCMIAAVNGDYSGLDYAYGDDAEKRAGDINDGLEALGIGLVPNFDCDTDEGHREFSRCGCDCCGSGLAGEMYRFAVLGDG
jgi:hypothetical protein